MFKNNITRKKAEQEVFNMVSDSIEYNGEQEEIMQEIEQQTDEELEMFLIEGGYFENK